MERERPLRVAVVGEFNAGKSTFLNALLGVDVAPTGVLPTTATLHWVAWAPDAFARIVVSGAHNRVVPHAELKATLARLSESHAMISRVFILAPIERLKRVEILDTPGFNAPEADHISAARQAFEEAHVAIWLLDAAHPLKETERRVLVELKLGKFQCKSSSTKIDRVKAEDRSAVVNHVREALKSVSFSSYSPPIAFSAKLSLRGRLGDADALAASGWALVEELFAERIVDSSESLKERALRRRAAQVATELAAVASSRASVDRGAQRAARARAESLRQAATRIRRDRAALAASIDQAIEPARHLLKADLRPLGALPEDRQRSDAGLRDYLSERFVTRLGDPVLAELARCAAGSAVGSDPFNVPTAAASGVRAVLLGAVASQDMPRTLVEGPLVRVLESAIEAYAAALNLGGTAAARRAPLGGARTTNGRAP